MSIKREVGSLLRWTATFTFLNAGLLAVCLYGIMRNEQCSRYLQDATFDLGKFWLIIGAVLLAVTIPLEIVDVVAKRRERRLSR